MKKKYYITIVDFCKREQPAVINIINDTNEQLEETINKNFKSWSNLKYTTIVDDDTNTTQITGSHLLEDKMFSILILNE